MSTAVNLLTSAEIVYLPISKITPNPYQPRKFFEKSQLEDLANSIKEYGVIQPVSVRLINGRSYELVAGERRLRASKLAGLETIPAIVVKINDQDSAIIALIENLQRQDLNFLEEAEGLNNLISDYAFTQEQLAERIGKKQSTIANKLRLLRLPKNVQKVLIENGLTERHARALLKLPDEQMQLDVLKKVIADGLNVKKTENYIEARLAKIEEALSPKKDKKSVVKPFVKDIRLFTNTIKQAVDVMNSAGLATVFDVEESKDGYFMSILITY
ncbi:MAG: nucleoid occlusion protein [Clostridiales bacterium]|jgi:ParB family chromosome partitioning protein|nr:nucleoid occlusion protein [Clostridiales bacterium]